MKEREARREERSEARGDAGRLISRFAPRSLDFGFSSPSLARRARIVAPVSGGIGGPVSGGFFRRIALPRALAALPGALAAPPRALAALPCALGAQHRAPAAWSGALALVALTVALALVLAGCAKPAPPSPPGVSVEAERGPIHFEVSATPRSVWIGDPVTLTLTATLPSDLVAALPTAGDLPDLHVRAATTADPLPTIDGKTVWSRTLTIDFLTSGEKDIPPLVLKYGPRPATSQPAASRPTAGQSDAGQPDAGQTAAGRPARYDNELAANSLKIEVRSALTSQDSIAAPRDITGVLTPPPPPFSTRDILMIVSAIVAGLLLTAAATWWILRALLKPPPPLSPEAWALRELSLLEGQDWRAVGEARDYYYRMSEIVRAYIERKFGLRAPEMTTEEFLSALLRDRSRLPVDAATLREFMERCDLVKYAAFAPTAADAAAALRTARAFVESSAAAWAAMQAAKSQNGPTAAPTRPEGKAA